MGNRLVHEKLTGSRLYCGLFDPSETQFVFLLRWLVQ